jgi:hypothetical protein
MRHVEYFRSRRLGLNGAANRGRISRVVTRVYPQGRMHEVVSLRLPRARRRAMGNRQTNSITACLRGDVCAAYAVNDSLRILSRVRQEALRSSPRPMRTIHGLQHRPFAIRSAFCNLYSCFPAEERLYHRYNASPLLLCLRVRDPCHCIRDASVTSSLLGLLDCGWVGGLYRCCISLHDQIW